MTSLFALLPNLGTGEIIVLLIIGILLFGRKLPDVGRYLVTGIGVPGVWMRDRISRWSIPHVRAVGRAIDEQHRPVGASWWPGYFVGTTTPIAVDLANDFGMVIADKVPAARRRRFHIVSHDEVALMVKRHNPPLFHLCHHIARRGLVAVVIDIPANGCCSQQQKQ